MYVHVCMSVCVRTTQTKPETVAEHAVELMTTRLRMLHDKTDNWTDIRDRLLLVRRRVLQFRNKLLDLDDEGSCRSSSNDNNNNKNDDNNVGARATKIGTHAGWTSLVVANRLSDNTPHTDRVFLDFFLHACVGCVADDPVTPGPLTRRHRRLEASEDSLHPHLWRQLDEYAASHGLCNWLVVRNLPPLLPSH